MNVLQIAEVLVCLTIVNSALQREHEKTQLEKWEDAFLRRTETSDQTSSLIKLVSAIVLNELQGCSTIILYDNFTESTGDLLLEKLLRNFPVPYRHGQISENYHIKESKLISEPESCVNYILFLKDVMRCKSVIGPQTKNKVVIVARSSQWRVYEFLASEESRSFLNLLVIAKSENIVSSNIELPFILYTHKLYTDGLGSSTHQVLTSWKNENFSRTYTKLFPRKITEGFSGHRFIISVANQPPFVIRRGRDENEDVQWDGIEIRLIDLLSKMFNFTTDFREAQEFNTFGSAETVAETVRFNRANLGIAGVYTTTNRILYTDMSASHSQDCAAFISLTSTALPRYRAIMGPFHWSVWLSVVFIYLFSIFPLAFSDKHTLKHLVETPEEIENMFWYVFGTFTNCFTFVGKKSWNKSEKFATRLLVAFYWLFSIIITACYTGSIIAFVTLPVYPATVDSPKQLLSGHYQVGTLNKDGWQYWFENSSEPLTKKLLDDIDLVPDIESGLKNITKAFFWPYAFLGSRAQLDYIVRSNFTMLGKRSLLHISKECFVPFSVGLVYNKNALYKEIIDSGLLRVVQSGIINKIKNDVEWLIMRSASGKLLAANAQASNLKSLSVEDRALTLDDTQGMFLLLGIGFVAGGASLLSEWFGGCLQLCKKRNSKSSSSIVSNYRSHETPTPRQKLDSLRYNELIDKSRRQSEQEPNCIVHNENIDKQIDKYFNFEEVFGQPSGNKGSNEELNQVK